MQPSCSAAAALHDGCMRALLVVLGLVIASTAAWYLRRPSATAPPAQDVTAPTTRSTTPPTAATGDPERLAAEEPAAPDAAPAAVDAQPTTPSPQLEAPPIEVEVRSLTTQELVAAFRYRFTAGETVWNGAVESGRAGLRIEPGVTGDLLIEAPGMQPEVRRGLTLPSPPAPPMQLQLFLRPAAVAEGITLLVRDVDRRAVAQVRVDAFALIAGEPQGAWHLGKPLWSRAASADDGRYVLPKLAPGSYGVQVVAVDREDRPLPLAPYRRVYDLTGSNGFLEDVSLEPACALQLDLYDASGAPFDPSTRGDVRITLQRGGEPAVSRRWTGPRAGGALDQFQVSEVDRVPGPAPIWLATAAAPGPYVLEVSIDGQTVTRQPLQLAAIRQIERVLVP